MPRPASRTTAVVSSLAGVTGVFLLAGCSAQAPATEASAPQPSSSTVGEPTQTTDSTGATADSAGGEGSGQSKYTDGTYTAEGSYSPQAGLIETIAVTITLDGDVITAVAVEGDPQKPESVKYQGQFIGGIADVVVGRSIDEINVSRVAGSSLTSGGFNQAIDAIKADAAA